MTWATILDKHVVQYICCVARGEAVQVVLGIWNLLVILAVARSVERAEHDANMGCLWRSKFESLEPECCCHMLLILSKLSTWSPFFSTCLVLLKRLL